MDKTPNTSWIKLRIKSFKYAFEGLWMAFRTEKNFQLQLIIALLVVVLGGLLNVTMEEWRWLLLSIFLVLAAEIFNSSIEALADAVNPAFDKRIKKVKDLAAAAVLILAIAALLIGLSVFIPKIIALLV